MTEIKVKYKKTVEKSVTLKINFPVYIASEDISDYGDHWVIIRRVDEDLSSVEITKHIYSNERLYKFEIEAGMNFDIGYYTPLFDKSIKAESGFFDYELTDEKAFNKLRDEMREHLEKL